MRPPLFSVIVPTYGRRGLLRDAVGSVLEQTVDDLEVLVVDDAGPEPVRLPAHPRVRVVRRERNGGPAAARNSGLDLARGRHVAFLDDDDLYAPDRLELALAGLERAPLAVCWSGSLGAAAPPAGRVLEGDVSHVVLDGLVPHVGATAVRRTAAVRFDERYRACEDIEWWLRLAAAAPVATVPRVGHLTRRHGGPRHGTGYPERIRARLDLLAAYPSYFEAHPRATAFSWKRVGIMAGFVGDRRLARRALTRALRIRFEPGTAWHLVRSLASGPAGRSRRAAPRPPPEQGGLPGVEAERLGR